MSHIVLLSAVEHLKREAGEADYLKFTCLGMQLSY